jgi:hypothetical protein
MRRLSIALLALAALALSAASAFGHGPGHGPGGGPGDRVGDRGGFGDAPGERAFRFHGTVTSVDADAKTVTVKLAAKPYRHGDDDDTPETVTVKVDDDTLILRDGKEAALGALAAGDGVDAAIVAEGGSTQAEVLNNAAYVIRAQSPKALYGFAGAVTNVDEENDKITIKVKYATKSARALIGAGASPELTFTVDGGTECHLNRRSRGIDLEDIDVGDLAAVAVLAPKGSTLDDVLATPAEATFGLTGSRAALRKASRRKGLTALTARAVAAARR